MAIGLAGIVIIVVAIAIGFAVFFGRRRGHEDLEKQWEAASSDRTQAADQATSPAEEPSEPGREQPPAV